MSCHEFYNKVTKTIWYIVCSALISRDKHIYVRLDIYSQVRNLEFMSSQVENHSLKGIKKNQFEEYLIKRYADLSFFVLNMRPAAVISQTLQYYVVYYM